MTKAKEASEEALRRMYSEAEPPADFDEILDNPEDQPDDWYTQHYLDGDRQQEIVEEVCDEYGLRGRERQQVTMTAILHYGPVSVRDDE